MEDGTVGRRRGPVVLPHALSHLFLRSAWLSASGYVLG